LTDEWVFSREFEPRLKPNEYVLINNQYYQVVETRPMFPFYLVLTNLTAQQTLDLRDYGLKADTNQLLNYRLKINGPAQLLIGVQGLAGYNYGGWGTQYRYADETTPEHMLEFFQLGRDVGWLAVQVNPITTPAWVRIKAYGYVYKVAPASGAPQKYLVPPYIAYGVSPTLR